MPNNLDFILSNGTNFYEVNFPYSVRQFQYRDFQYVTPNKLLGRSSSTSGIAHEISIGSGLSLINGVLSSSSGSGSSIYGGASPATIALGGVPSGYVLTGKTYDQIIQQLLVVYQSPSFTGFGISGQTNPLEVGQALSGSKTFVWSTSNSGNITPNSISIVNVNTSTTLISGSSNDGSETLAIGTITNTSPINQQFRISATNTNSVSFNTTYNITSKYPCFYGKVASGGVASGLNRPTINQNLINGSNGTAIKMPLSTNEGGTINVTFSSTSDDYVWLAVPAFATTKTIWYQTALNTGAIGGSISAGGNLFPSPFTLNINSPTGLWTGVSYKVYLANYQSAISGNLEFRNS